MAKSIITITEHMSELIYDIQNKTYLTGRSRNTGTNHEEVAGMQANDDDENADQIIRSIGNAFASLKIKLAEYLSETGTTANNTLISDNSNLILVLMMPGNFNQSANETIAISIHKYIVNMAVGEWFVITNKNDAEDYLKMAGSNIDEIREAINKRKRPVRQKNI